MLGTEFVNFLIIDDDNIDVLTMTRSLSKQMNTASITVAKSGAEGLLLLRSGAISRPYIILVDVRMPEMSGHEFVSELRMDARLRNSVIFMVSTSGASEDIDKAYGQCVAGYVVKNASGADLSNVVGMLKQYASVVQMRS